jgi:membrane-associated phospholipid phosphatase
MSPVARALRPLEWALLAFFLFVLVRAGPGVFSAWKDLLGGRATTVLFTLGLVAAIQLLWRFTALAWHARVTPPMRRVVWAALPLSLLPWAFALSVVLRSSLVQEDLMQAEARTAIAAGAGMFMFTVGFGLPTFLAWLLFANLLREHGEVRWPRVKAALGVALSTFRDWAPLLVVLSGYEWMRAVVDAGFTGPRDEVMKAIDLKLFFGTDPLDLLEGIIWKPLTEVIAFAYSFYAVLFPLVLGTVFVTGGKRALRISAFRVGCALLIAYVGYCLVPVKGPLFTRTFDVPLDTWLVGPIKEALMDATRISYDCFPSMHTCCTLLLAVCAWQFARKLFWVISPIVVLMPLACVYLRYHYVIDVIAGAALVFPLVWLSKKLERWITPDDDSAAARSSP